MRPAPQGSRGPAILAYYSGGVQELPRNELNIESTPDVPIRRSFAAVPPGPALGRGVYVAYAKLQINRKRIVTQLATRYGVPQILLDAPSSGPDAATKIVEKAQADLGSEDAAVLAFFLGYDTARFAAERTRARATRSPSSASRCGCLLKRPTRSTRARRRCCSPPRTGSRGRCRRARA